MRKFKTTLFHFRQMLRVRAPFYYYVQYCKNRFFWQYLVAKIPPLQNSSSDDCELHILCQKADVWMLVWAVYSFMHYSKLSPRIIIHDDGSFDESGRTVLKKIFPQLRIISKKEADELITARADIPETIRVYRNIKNKLALKLVDIFLLGTAEKMLVLDSDILFYASPKEIIDFVRTANGPDALISWSPITFPLTVKEEYILQHKLKEKDIEHMNSGLIAYRRSSIPLSMFFEYFENLSNGDDYFSEMTGWCALIAQTNFRFLPAEKYIIKGDIGPNTITKHFTSPRRFEMFAYGIDLVRSNIFRKK